MTACTLCDLPTPDPPVSDDAVDGSFCCRGCMEVYRALGDVAVDDVDATDIRAARGEESEPADPVVDGETAYLSVSGMHCKTCEAFIEATAAENEGIQAAQASYATDMVKLTYDPDRIEEEGLPDAISKLGYRASPPEEGVEDEEENRFEVSRLRTAFSFFTTMSTMAMYLLFLYPTYLGFYPESFLHEESATIMVFTPVVLMSTLVLFGVGFPILRGAYVSLKARQPNMDVLVAFAALAAYSYSMIAFFLLGHREVYFDVSTMVIAVVNLGNYVENKFKRQAVGNLSELSRSRVTDARRLLADGGSETVDVESCGPGDRVLVKPGERIPVDGTVVEGSAAVDESLITGESIPQSRGVGDQVVGGAVVTDSALVVEVGEEVSSTLDRLMELLWNIQSTDSGMQQLADRIAAVFVPLVVTLAVVTTLFWVYAGASVGAAILTGVAVLVISCPCSLGLATPLAIVSGIRQAADRQIVVLDSTMLERIVDTDIVAFDKTGTLTTGTMKVVDVTGPDPDALVARMAAVEQFSSHPIANAVAEYADVPDAEVTDFERSARGVSATVDGTPVLVGHPELFTAEGWTVPVDVERAVERARTDSLLPTVVGWTGEARGVVSVSDDPRPDWEEVVSRLAEEDCEIVVITGDDESMARRFRDHPDVDDVFAGVPPEAKVEVVRRLRAKGTTTMIGDGTNDAPALATADLGIALSGGTEIAMEAADAVVISETLAPITQVFDVAAGTNARIKQNLGWAFLYNAIAIPLAVAGLINPLIASLAMAISSIIVVTNSARKMLD